MEIRKWSGTELAMINAKSEKASFFFFSLSLSLSLFPSHWNSALRSCTRPYKHTQTPPHISTCYFNLRSLSLSLLPSLLVFCLLAINIQLKVNGGWGGVTWIATVDSSCFFSPLFSFAHELWRASTGTFSRAASKLNAVCRHATQEQHRPSGDTPACDAVA